ncbi:deoxycytidylate deaminase isoform X2 [Protopterus annectens]|uniref:deoxycytidylate deaminase isoform X2 n=1 Tax=Protopterus annectens TaxID=7888 RepID=UPI001CFB4C5C|nr:deoxycytidylate deaminase isoform X2 [Protopterus annectens]
MASSKNQGESAAIGGEQQQWVASEPACKKRDDYLEWPEYFMAVAFLSAQRSKDPNSQVGACIVNPEHKIVGIGYNGMPNGCSDDVLPWARTAKNKLDTKYPYVCHAELNAIMNKNSADVKGCTMYVALFPCNECAKLIIQAGIKEVIFMSDKYHDTPEMTAARRLFDLAEIKYMVSDLTFGSGSATFYKLGSDSQAPPSYP